MRVTAGRPIPFASPIHWVRSHNSQSFLESYYFQYGHQSIADLGHAALCFEGISELAASEVEDETLWDGQAKSSRYQDFSKAGFIMPSELQGEQATLYSDAGEALLRAYKDVHARVNRASFGETAAPRIDEAGCL